jgi:hypothetical protein
MSNAVVEAKPARMAIKSTSERITLFKLALDVNRHERDELMNSLMHGYIVKTLSSDSTHVYPCDDAVDRVSDVFNMLELH